MLGDRRKRSVPVVQWFWNCDRWVSALDSSKNQVVVSKMFAMFAANLGNYTIFLFSFWREVLKNHQEEKLTEGLLKRKAKHSALRFVFFVGFDLLFFFSRAEASPVEQNMLKINYINFGTSLWFWPLPWWSGDPNGGSINRWHRVVYGHREKPKIQSWIPEPTKKVLLVVTIASWVGVDPIGCILFFPDMSVLDIFPDPQDVETYVDLWKFPTFVTDPNCKKLHKLIISYTCNTCLSINLSSKASLKGSLKNATPKSLIFLVNGLQHLEFKQNFPKNTLG